jgi:glyoxylase-like metal-dependent hydrolase (beta-lactamase superfamily II)
VTFAHSAPQAQWRWGGVAVHRIDEIAGTELLEQFKLLPQATPAEVAPITWLRPDFVDDAGALRASVHAFAVQIGQLRVLVDTGIGNGKSYPGTAFDQLDTPFLARLEQAGFPAETVDIVITTHLHPDHVGWNTHLVDDKWTPTFPRARYLISRTEFEFWKPIPRQQRLYVDSFDPVAAAGQLELVEVGNEGTEVAPGLVLRPAPGHTPGQLAVEVSDGGRSGLVGGDWVHHPAQLAHPEWVCSADIDAELAERNRRDLLGRLAGTENLLIGAHFATPTAGLIRAEGDAFRLLPVP